MGWKGIRSLWSRSRPSCGKPVCRITASAFSAITTRAPDRRPSTAPMRMRPASRLPISTATAASTIPVPRTPVPVCGPMMTAARMSICPRDRQLPVVTTQAVTGISTTTATGNGNRHRDRFAQSHPARRGLELPRPTPRPADNKTRMGRSACQVPSPAASRG